MAFTIPPMPGQIPTPTLLDVSANAQRIQQGMSQLARLSRGAGGGGGGVPRGWGTMIVEDPTAPGGVREVAVPGATVADRQRAWDAMQRARATEIINSDPDIQEKLARLPSEPVGEQSKTLDDIRRNDIVRLSQQYGFSSPDLMNAVLEPTRRAVRERTRAVDSAETGAVIDSVKLGLSGLADAISNIGATPEQRLASAEEHEQYRQRTIRENAYLQDQELRRQQGQGFFERMGGSTGSIRTNILSSFGESLGGTGAAIGAGMAGARIGAILGPYGALAGGIIGAASTMAPIEAQSFASRISADPNLSQAEKVAAIEEGVPRAAALGAVVGSVPVGVGRVAGAVAPALARAGVPVVSRVAAPATSMLGGYGQRTALMAAELAAMSGIGVTGQNLLYSDVTGQQVPVTEGLGEALAHSLVTAPIFGIIPRPRAAVRPEPVVEEAPPRPPQLALPPSGEVLAPAVVEPGTPPIVPPRPRLIEPVAPAGEAVRPEADALRNLFTNARRMRADDPDRATQIVRETLDAGVDPTALRSFIETSALAVRKKQNMVDTLNQIQEAEFNAAFRRPGETVPEVVPPEGVTDVAVTSERPVETSSRSGSAPIVANDVAVRETAPTVPSVAVNRTVEAGPPAIIAADAPTAPRETLPSNRTTESRGIGGAEEPYIRSSEAPLVPLETEGVRTIAGRDTGSGTEPAALANATGSPGTGGVESQAVRSTSLPGDVPAVSPVERTVIETPTDVTQVVAEETGLPVEAVQPVAAPEPVRPRTFSEIAPRLAELYPDERQYNRAVDMLIRRARADAGQEGLVSALNRDEIVIRRAIETYNNGRPAEEQITPPVLPATFEADYRAMQQAHAASLGPGERSYISPREALEAMERPYEAARDVEANPFCPSFI